MSIAKDIIARLDKGVEPSDIAVLSRANAPLRALAKSLKAMSIPFTLSAEIDIFSHTEVINLWYLLQWIDGSAQFDAISHVLLGPFLLWQPADLAAVVGACKRDLIPLENALRNMAYEGLNESANSAIKRWPIG
jgi:ATP-dependent exoDNAse (exonuclease V) beta subunit